MILHTKQGSYKGGNKRRGLNFIYNNRSCLFTTITSTSACTIRIIFFLIIGFCSLKHEYEFFFYNDNNVNNDDNNLLLGFFQGVSAFTIVNLHTTHKFHNEPSTSILFATKSTTSKSTASSVKDELLDIINNQEGCEYDDNNHRILKGKNKWLGGAIDNDGTIYGIPSNSNKIICLRPTTKNTSISTSKSKSNDNNCIDDDGNDNNNDLQHYQIHTVPLPKEIQQGKFKWLRGIICNNNLYGIPAWSNDGVLKLDLLKLWSNSQEEEGKDNGTDEDVDADTNIDLDIENKKNNLVSVIPLPDEFYNLKEEQKPTRWLWHGAALNANKTAIYCIPSNAHQVLKVDLDESKCSLLPIPDEIKTTSTSTSTTIEATPLGQTNKWYGGILGDDNAIYGIPYSAANVLRIDANTDTVSLLGSYGLKKYNWHGGIKAEKNGYIYCFPAHHSHVLKIDTNSNLDNTAVDDDADDIYSRLSLVPIRRASYDKDQVTRYKWLGGSMGKDGNIYGMPSDASSILRIDTKHDTATTFGLVSGEKNKYQGGILSDDGMVYAIPSNAKHILCIDTNEKKEDSNNISSDGNASSDGSDEIKLVGELPPTKDKFQGGFVGRDGQIYCIPENYNKVMKVIPDKENTEVTFL